MKDLMGDGFRLLSSQWPSFLPAALCLRPPRSGPPHKEWVPSLVGALIAVPPLLCSRY